MYKLVQLPLVVKNGRRQKGTNRAHCLNGSDVLLDNTDLPTFRPLFVCEQMCEMSASKHQIEADRLNVTRIYFNNLTRAFYKPPNGKETVIKDN